MKDHVLVPAKAAEPERLASLHAACFSPGWDAPFFRDLLARETTIAFAAVPPGWPADPEALILVQVAAGQCEILTLGTLPDSRRQGLARALVIASATEAQQKGAGEMFLEVAKDNAAARALYASLGFTAAGERRAYYRDRVGRLTDALILRAALPLAR